MKFKVQMKDPDVLHDAICEAVGNELRGQGITNKEEFEAIAELRHTRVQNLCAKWFRYGEYLAVEIDTDAETCTVISARD